MKILFDAAALQPSQGKFHGGGEYARTLLYKLIEVKSKRDHISACYLASKWIDETILRDCKAANITLYPLQSQQEIFSLINSEKFDKFYSALPYTYARLKTGRTVFSMTIHGLRDLEMPSDKYEMRYTKTVYTKIKVLIKQCMPKLYRKYVSNNFNALLANENYEIFVPSQHTRYAMTTLLGVSPDDIFVCYSPRKIEVPAKIHPDDAAIEPLFDSVKDYILIVSGDRWIKNSWRALRALTKYLKDKYEVVLVGGNFLKKLFRNNKSIHFIDYVESETLEYLYKNARVLLYPTLNEGFGYPPLEAMKYGTPVIASAITSLTEVYGDDMLYINPYSLEEIATRVTQLMSDSKVHAHYVARAKARYRIVRKAQADALEQIAEKILSK